MDSKQSFQFPWDWLRLGTRRSWRKPPAWPQWKQPQTEYAGPSLPWSILRATPAGEEWRKEQGKIRFSAPRWPRLTCGDIREHAWTLRTASHRVSSIMLDTALPRLAETTIPLKFPNTPCGSFICRHFTPRSMPELPRL